MYVEKKYGWVWQRTEDEPCLTELKVYAEVCVEAHIRDGDVGTWLPTQSSVLPVAVPDTWKTEWER